jgi:hypothetical protein
MFSDLLTNNRVAWSVGGNFDAASRARQLKVVRGFLLVESHSQSAAFIHLGHMLLV